ncbi:MAG TPA: hypothetical protein VNJ51_01735 [Candidatus Dormibacteraeota bacterium]|nr:hypothetical protein [Candidatus Dormibacteraeota bacterium]
MGSNLLGHAEHPPARVSRGRVAAAAALLVALAVAWAGFSVLTRPGRVRALPFRGSVVAGSPQAPDLELIDEDGGAIRLSSLRGDAVLVMPESVCPPRCDEASPPLRLVHDLAGPWGRRIAVIDAPLGGTRPDLARLHRNVPGLHAIVATANAPQALRALSASTRGAPGARDGAADRAAYLIDPEGRLRVVYAAGVTLATATNVAHDLGIMVGQVFPGEPGSTVCL